MGESLVDLILKNGDTDRRAAQEYCDLQRHIGELEAQLKAAKRDGIIAAVSYLTAYVVPIELKSCVVYKAIDLIDYANSLTGEE